MDELGQYVSSFAEKEQQNTEFFNDNSFILSVLPSLLQDLYNYDSNLDVLSAYIDTQIKSQNADSDIEKLRQLKSQVQYLTRNKPQDDKKTLVIDENKSIMMHLFLGRIFTQTLEILSCKDNIQLWVVNRNESIDAEAVGDRYLACLGAPEESHLDEVFVRVAYDTVFSEEVQKSGGRKVAELVKQLQFLELRRLLESVGLTYDSHGNLISIPENHPPHSTEADMENLRSQLRAHVANPTQPCLVDLDNWYCSCPDYQRCYTHAFHHRDPQSPTDSPSGSSQPAFQSAILAPDHLTAKYPSGEHPSLIHHLLGNCRSNLLDPIPICPHILSILIIAYNRGLTASYTVQKASSLSWILARH